VTFLFKGSVNRFAEIRLELVYASRMSSLKLLDVVDCSFPDDNLFLVLFKKIEDLLFVTELFGHLLFKYI